MGYLSERTLDHLRRVAQLPDLSGARYQIERELGRGGMSVVYKARDTRLGRSVALKVIDEHNDNPEAESRVVAQLEHPGIVPLYDAGSLPDGRAYYVMKLVEGVRLDEFLSRSSTLAERLRIFQRVCDAVGFAHSRGVVHRDLKPQNIMIGEFGEVLVMDWGVARRLEEPEPPGVMAGTPRYMAPEQGASPQCDVYSLGALLEDLLDEERPRALAAIVAKAKNPVPAARYQSAADLAADIGRFLDREPVHAHRETMLEAMLRFGKRNSTLLMLVAAYLIIRLLFLIAR
jgi:serine/threonine protein kinase